MMFLDTLYLGALFMTNDQWYEAAWSWAPRASPPLLTTDYVLLELADGLSRPKWRPTFDRILGYVRKNPDVRIISQSPSLFERGINLYQSRRDKPWSLTDCLSFIVTKDEGCGEALTSDIHFVQAGFRALLRESP